MVGHSKKREQAEATLPAELRDTFDLLVADYQSSSEQHVSKIWVNYNILADLVRGGWRKMS